MQIIGYITVFNVAVAQILLTLVLTMINISDFIRVPIATIIIIGSIFAYGNYRCQHPEFKDPLEKPLFHHLPWLDGWALTHFLTFFWTGFVLKNPIVLKISLFVGLMWEVFEHVVGKRRPGWMGGYGGCNLATDKKDDGNWWYGKWTDIVMNTTGLILGFLLQKLI